MADPKQPRESAPAALDDILGEAARNDGTMEGLDPRVGGDGTPRDRSDLPCSERGQVEGEARPGKDENQAGFVKDADKRFQP
ncbi:hypothetical protein PE066_21115 [Ramlibacter tataouinensis]|uniref:hypothetical protein n=1 Tax=Ramlibacter tataouinensis TaxID=94132 RepID=UPI0022F3D6CE|nr:hypothetical protein [Ramlibacter tataouinensis]WBY01913.1 hypothetical protein PE066_21115 [Ramlibacter tataouinensis]